MVQRNRGRGDTTPRAPELLEAMGHCRDRLPEAGNGVRPFGTAYHAIHLVTTAIDTLALFITGQQHFYPIGGSVQAAAPMVPALRPDNAAEPGVILLSSNDLPCSPPHKSEAFFSQCEKNGVCSCANYADSGPPWLKPYGSRTGCWRHAASYV